MARSRNILKTPDSRYIVARGRLWRASNPNLTETERAGLVSDLMSARRAVGAARRNGDGPAENRAHGAVQKAKVGLGERGAVWWIDGAPDLNRQLAMTTSYASWYANQSVDVSGQ